MIDIASSLSATLVAELFTLPICTVKSVYLTNLTHRSLFDSTKMIISTRGFKGFCDSSHPAVISQLASTTSKYSSYEMIKRFRQTDSKSFVSNVFNGITAGAFSSLITHPIDFWKVHKQNGINIRTELKQKGSSVLYRGFPYTLQKNMMLTGIIFPAYDSIRNQLSNSNSMSVHMAPIISSFLTTLIIHPFDVRKTRGIMGNHSRPSWRNSMSYFYRGLHLSLFRTIPHFSLTMWGIEFFKRLLTN